MEALLRSVLPEAEHEHIHVAKFADDLTLYKVSNDVAILASWITLHLLRKN